ncbi:hypothetical protein, partial [Streptomyces sp. NPDC096153]|uniref:hypothetical protein n=1 Tax=Streptomyces sp. NPDC096153 TaxID=3155548 RepID=UPI00331E052F
WHAVEFSRNGRFLRTHPQNILSGFPPGASLRRFQPYQIRFPFRSRFGIHFRWPLEGLLSFDVLDVIRTFYDRANRLRDPDKEFESGSTEM